jgi:hypothetical protein
MMTPIKIYGDGNCFFRVLSKYIYGCEKHHKEMRVRVVLEMVQNEDIYDNNEQLNLMSEYQVKNLVKKLREHSTPDGIHSYEDYVISTFKLATWVGLWHFFAAANCLQTPVRSIYPDVPSPFVNRKLYNQLISPVKFSDRDILEDVVIMWTNLGNNTLTPVWSPNHFVLCTPSSAIKDSVTGKRKAEDQKSSALDETKKKKNHHKYKTKFNPSWTKFKYITAEPSDQYIYTIFVSFLRYFYVNPLS